MTEKYVESYLKITLPIIVAALMAFGILISFTTGDPHCLNRTGAAIAAIAAGAILLQIRTEIALEKQRSALEEGAKRMSENADISPIETLETRLINKRLETQCKNLSKDRLRVASIVIAFAMMGELLHGFGDILMCQAFSVCSSHG